MEHTMQDAAPAPAAAPERRGLPLPGKEVTTLTLSNGCVAELREATGDDLIKAADMAQTAGGGDVAVSLALVALVTRFDGERVPFEDVRAARAPDLARLIQHVLGNAPSLGLATSSA